MLVFMGIIMLVTTTVSINNDRIKNYFGYKVYEAFPKTARHMEVLRLMIIRPEYDFWSSAKFKKPVLVMVAPESQREFMTFMEGYHIPHRLIIKDVSQFLESVSDRSIDGGSGINYCKENVNNKEDKIIFDHYPRWNEVNKYMDLLARSYPELVSIEEIGRTHENRTLRVLRISTARRGRRHRKAILIDGGIHAREWVAPAMVLYVVNQIVEHRSSNGEMLEGVDWFALPVVNPDGYEFTHSYDRLWRKNRGPTTRNSSCIGTDCNRNFDIHWGGAGTSPEPCSNLYAGTEPFSEPESRALSSFMLDNMPFIKMYLTFHSFGQSFLYPWGHTKELPDDWEELDELARKAVEAIIKTGGPRFEVGSSSNVLSFGAGGADDFAKGRANIKYAYTVEMPGGGPNGFDLPATSLCLHLHSLYQGLRVMVKALREE